MKALVATRFGNYPQMEIQDRSIPAPREGYTLVRMHAATVNPLSNQIRNGTVPTAKAPLVLSNDGSGIVEQSGHFAPGTRVAIFGGGDLGIKEDGLQQEYALVENKRLFALPETVDLDAGAALPVAFVTAYQALNRIGKLKPGQSVLIVGATGSVGHALVQLSLALGAHPIAVVSNADKVARAAESGASNVIDLSSQDLKTAVLEATGGRGADLAFDPVGGNITNELLLSVCPHGTVVSIGFAGGVTAQVDLIDLVVHEKRLLGYDLHLETDADVATAFKAIMDLAGDKKVGPALDNSYPIEAFEEAYGRLTSRRATGTILLRF